VGTVGDFSHKLVVLEASNGVPLTLLSVHSKATALYENNSNYGHIRLLVYN
jgi:hypothetical protein